MSDQILSVVVDRTTDGAYVPTVHLDGRHLLALDRFRVSAYVMTWADAIARAEHDAAVFAQLTGMGVDTGTAARVLTNDVHATRPPLDDGATAPLVLRPMTSARTLRGAVAAFLDGEKIMQLAAPEIYDHIGKVLPVVATCELDAGYHRYAVDVLNQPGQRAAAMVADLARWRMSEREGAAQDRATRKELARVTAAVRSARRGPALLPSEVQDALLMYASAVAAARDGRAAPGLATMARRTLERRCLDAGLDPAQVIPPAGVALNPGGRWIPAKRRGRNRASGSP